MLVNEKELRKFGLILTSGIGLIGIILPYFRHHTISGWVCALVLSLALIAFLQAKWLNFLYRPWMKLGHGLGWINTRIILGGIYFLVITPIGLLMRLCGYDPMDRAFIPQASSYRKKNCLANDPKHMEKPF